VHVVTADYDEGPVILQSRVPVQENDDIASLRARVQATEPALYINALRQFLASSL
jgi:phosphoribosylglycinamide formyltransferase-1